MVSSHNASSYNSGKSESANSKKSEQLPMAYERSRGTLESQEEQLYSYQHLRSNYSHGRSSESSEKGASKQSRAMRSNDYEDRPLFCLICNLRSCSISAYLRTVQILLGTISQVRSNLAFLGMELLNRIKAHLEACKRSICAVTLRTRRYMV